MAMTASDVKREAKAQEFDERFERDEFTGQMALKATGCMDRLKNAQPQRTREEDKWNDPEFMSRYMSQSMIMGREGVAEYEDEIMDEMMDSVVIIKHVDSPDCEHCK